MENPTFTDDDGVRPRKHDAIGTQVVEGSLSTAIQRALGTHADAAGDSSEKLAGSESQEDGSGSLPPEKDEVHLKRRVGLLSGVALIVGTMIGSGIFVSPTGLLERTGSVGLSLIIWAACGLLSMLGALSYAELGIVIPYSGGEIAYYVHSFGPLHHFFGPLLGFLFGWTSVLLLKPSSLAILTLTFAKYVVLPFWELRKEDGSCDGNSEELSEKLVAALCIGVITFVNCFDVKLATRVQNVFTTAKLLAVVIIVITGIVKFAQGESKLNLGFNGTTKEYGKIATAFYSGLWAYDGWNNLNYVTEELKNPYVNLPRAIMIAIPLVTVCYLLVNISYLIVLDQATLLASDAVAVDFGKQVLGVMAWIMPVSVALSTFGAANGTEFTSGRLCYAAAREGHLVDILSYVHVRRMTPSPALIFNGLIALAMITVGDINSLIDFFSFTAWIFYGGAMAALIVMRYTKRDVPRPYKVHISIPIIVMVISAYLVVAPIIDNPQMEYLYASCFIAGGLIFYYPFVYRKWVLLGMNKITVLFQLLLEVVPTDKLSGL